MSSPSGAGTAPVRDSVSIRTPEYYRRLAAYEAADPWAQAMADWSLYLVDRYRGSLDGLCVVDSGCGAGGFLGRLPGAMKVGLDVDRAALQVAAERSPFPSAQAAAEALPLGDASVDAVFLHDVLQHAPVGSFEESARVLRPGGLLVLRTAARRGLGSKKHRDSHDYRQWTSADLRRLCEKSDLEVRFLARANVLPSLARDLVAFARSPAPVGDVGLPPPPQDAGWKQALLSSYWRVERGLIGAGLRFPWGHSLLLAASRR